MNRNCVSLGIFGETRAQVWYLDDAEPELLRDISQLLQLMVFAPKESLDLPEVRAPAFAPPLVRPF